MPRPLKISSLTIQLFLALTLFVTLPLGVMLFMGGSEIKQQFLKASEEDIHHLAEELGQQIDNYYATTLTNMAFISTSAEVLLNNKKSATEKVALQRVMKDFVREYEYENLFVGNAAGDIVFGARPHTAVGKNIHNASLSGSRLAISANSALSLKMIIHSGAVESIVDGKANTQIIVQPIIGEGGNPQGFLALEVSYGHVIPAVLEKAKQLKNASSIMVIDKLLAMVYSTESMVGHKALFATVPYLEWKRQNKTTEKMTTAVTYKNAKGINVLGAYRPVSIANNQQLLIIEMPLSMLWAQLQSMIPVFLAGLLTLWIMSTVFVLFFSRRIHSPLYKITTWIQNIADGKKANCYALSQNTDINRLSQSVLNLNSSFSLQRTFQQQKQWLEQRLSGLYEQMNGVTALQELCNKITIYLGKNINASSAGMYLMNNASVLVLTGKYGCSEKGCLLTVADSKEGGLVYEAIASNQAIELRDISENFFHLETAHLDQKPDAIYIVPFHYGTIAKGVMVFALIGGIKKQQEKLLNDAASPIASAVHSLELTLAKTEGEPI